MPLTHSQLSTLLLEIQGGRPQKRATPGSRHVTLLGGMREKGSTQGLSRRGGTATAVEYATTSSMRVWLSAFISTFPALRPEPGKKRRGDATSVRLKVTPPKSATGRTRAR